jgi:ATP synthase protein I
MNDYLKTIMRFALFFLSICLLIWVLSVPLRPYVAGLILGASVSLFNVYLLKRRIEIITQYSLQNEGKKAGLGFLARICSALLAVMISIKYPEQFHLVTTIIGLFLMQFFMLLIGILSKKGQA